MKIDYTDVGRYRCHVRNFYGDEWSQAANISVVGKFSKLIPGYGKCVLNFPDALMRSIMWQMLL